MMKEGDTVRDWGRFLTNQKNIVEIILEIRIARISKI